MAPARQSAQVDPHIAEHGAHERGSRAQRRHHQSQAHHKGEGVEKGLLFIAPGVTAHKAGNQG